ncbi:MAG TPA: hypothetical protein VLX28_11665, partial [Thermoanaerobaculia bacterium]|nr:hypothetical protein [Thermoanaerobaculia bacterium]
PAPPWAVALYRAAGWDGLKECLIANTASRFAHTSQSARFGHTQPIYYYLIQAPLQLLPWTLALPAMWRAGVFRRGAPGSEPRRLLLATAGIGVLLLSAASSKREMYLMPLIPAWSVCVAWWLAGVREESTPERAWDRRTLLTLLGFAGGVFLLLGALSLWIAWAPHLPATLKPIQTVVATWALSSFGVVALAIGAGLLAVLARWRQAGPPVSRVAFAMLLLFLVLQGNVQALIDPVKQMQDMAMEAERYNRGPGPIPAYLPPGQSNEVVFGMINFKLGRRVLPLTSPDEVRAWFEKHPDSRVLARAPQARKLPPELQRELLFSWDESEWRVSPYALLGLYPKPLENSSWLSAWTPAPSMRRPGA